MVACNRCGKNLTPVSKEVVTYARVRRVFSDIDRMRHDHSEDTSTLVWSCPNKHDLVSVKNILCWCENEEEKSNRA
jgi:hypothetical protein